MEQIVIKSASSSVEQIIFLCQLIRHFFYVLVPAVNASRKPINSSWKPGRFDDVQKPASLPSRTPREKKELDDNKSKKGLGAIYEDEYVQKTGLVSTALSFSDEQKKEASILFKKLCLKLDALSHFHFTPKPVIEDVSIQANVPALAMEEVAPVAVSDAAMLAPEEIFAGKGDVKEEIELTQPERKRRRANKKRKFKVDQIGITVLAWNVFCIVSHPEWQTVQSSVHIQDDDVVDTN
ncbi:hypothetical protein FXO38_21180 [Capsicum annuum]|nr:hypothetical protein FXO38_21180 [Capsicum annuum]